MPEKRRSAYLRATQEAQKVIPQSSETVKPLDREEVEESKKQDAFWSNETSNRSTPMQQGGEVIIQVDRVNDIQLHSETVKEQSSETVKKSEKISFYLTPDEARKLNDLEYEQRKRTGRRVNRNDLIRYLIDVCSSESFEGM